MNINQVILHTNFNVCFKILDLPKEEMVPKEQHEEIEPYLLEAGVDVELLSSNRQMVVQLLVV